MNEGLVSVIIPVYKVEQYLDKCVKSIVQQTYTNLEIILVDDGSPDNCPQICDVWAEKDNRIRVIHKKNGGLSDARNAGLDICTGTYIVFVDSDDYVHPEYVSYLHDLIMQHHVDLAICGFFHENENGKRIYGTEETGQIYIMDQCRALKEMCDCALFSNAAWGKIFLREYFADIRFPVGHVYEDLAIMYKLFLKAEKIVFGQRALYYYVHHENSITKSSFSWKQVDAVTYAEEMCEEIPKYWPELFVTAQRRLFTIYVCCWESVCLSRRHSEEITRLIDELYTKIKQVRKHIWREKLTTTMRAFLFASYLGKPGMEFCIFAKAKLFRLIKLR